MLGLDHKVLPREELDALLRRFATSKGTTRKAIGDTIIRGSFRLVYTIARKYRQRGVPIEDLFQEGVIGAMRGLEKFDPSRGCAWTTYSTWWIRHAICRAIEDRSRLVRLPVNRIDGRARITREVGRFASKHGREPAPEEIAQATGLSLATIHNLSELNIAAPVSLDAPSWNDEWHETLGARLEGDPEQRPDRLLEAKERRRSVCDLVDEVLTPRAIDVVHRTYGMNGYRGVEQSFEEIGKHHGRCTERVRQIQKTALRRLRAKVSKEELGDG
jgi:RNA polymerase primary sigma factor